MRVPVLRPKRASTVAGGSRRDRSRSLRQRWLARGADDKVREAGLRALGRTPQSKKIASVRSWRFAPRLDLREQDLPWAQVQNIFARLAGKPHRTADSVSAC
jgi:hypothetical protein